MWWKKWFRRYRGMLAFIAVSIFGLLCVGASYLLSAGRVFGFIHLVYTHWGKIVTTVTPFLFWGGLGAAVVCVVGAVILFFKIQWKWEQNANGLQAEFAPILESHADTRAALWNIFDNAFAKRRQVAVDPGSVRESMKRVKFPESILKIPQNNSLYDYAKKAVEEWDGTQGEFLGFCFALYQRGDSAILTLCESERMDSLRKVLAKFWNVWEMRCSGQDTSVSEIVSPDVIQSHTPEVLMLTYLEIARGLVKKENGRGKQGLFTVARDFCQASNLL